MKIPPEIIALIDRLYQELHQTEQNATQGLTVVKQILENFPDNVILIQFFAYLNSVLLFTEIYKRQAQNLVQRVSNVDVTEIEIQEVGEDLGGASQFCKNTQRMINVKITL